jgi:hypothetical protein
MIKRSKIRRQRPIRGGRFSRSAGLEARIDRALARLAARCNVTVPLVVSTLLADGLGIDLDALDRYDQRPLHIVKKEKAS